MKKSVALYDRAESGIFLAPDAVTTSGVLLSWDPPVRVAQEEKNEKLLPTVLELLDVAGQVVPHPTDFSNIGSSLYRLAGCKDWRSFAKKAKYCAIRSDESELTLTPGYWDGRGFNTPKGVQRIGIPISCPPQQFLRALDEVLNAEPPT